MNDMRNNGIVGIIEQDGLQPTSMHFAEWWNGEGFDVAFDEKPAISLHQTQLHALVVLACASDYVCMDTVKEDVEALLQESSKRREHIEGIRRANQVSDKPILQVVQNHE